MAELTLIEPGLTPDSWFLNFAWLRDRIMRLEQQVAALERLAQENTHGDTNGE